MKAMYELRPFIDGPYGELHVEGEFAYEHPLDGTANDTAKLGPHTTVIGRLIWRDGERELTIESWGTGHFWSIDEGAALLLQCFTITPGDGAEPDYWAEWTPAQLAWRDKYAKDVDALAHCGGEDDEGADNPCGKRHPDGCYGSSLKHLRATSKPRA